MAVGMVLLFAEVAIIPGFGIAGVAAALLLAGGVAVAWIYYGPAWGVGALLTAAVLTVGLIAIAPRTAAGKSFVLDAAITAQHHERSTVAVGQVGVAATALRPAGAADIAGRRVDVVTDGQFVAAGAPVRVIAVEGARVTVAIDLPATTSPGNPAQA